LEQVLQLAVVFFAASGIRLLPGELAIAGSVCYAAVIVIALTTDVRINHQIARSHAGRFSARPMIGRSFEPDGFDFTPSARSFPSGTGLLHSCVSCVSCQSMTIAFYRWNNIAARTLLYP
jgi:hypothetical protein